MNKKFLLLDKIKEKNKQGLELLDKIKKESEHYIDTIG